MLTLIPAPEEAWMPPVLARQQRRRSIEPIADALDGHVAYLKTSGELERRRRRIVTARVLKIAQDLVAETMLGGEGLGRRGRPGPPCSSEWPDASWRLTPARGYS